MSYNRVPSFSEFQTIVMIDVVSKFFNFQRFYYFPFVVMQDSSQHLRIFKACVVISFAGVFGNSRFLDSFVLNISAMFFQPGFDLATDFTNAHFFTRAWYCINPLMKLWFNGIFGNVQHISQGVRRGETQTHSLSWY
jgi:hypothetical protein